MKARVYFEVIVDIDVPKELEGHFVEGIADDNYYTDQLSELASTQLDNAIILPGDVYIAENFD